MKKVIILILLLNFSTPSYALTESEKDLYTKWSLKSYNFSTLYFDNGQRDCLGFTSDFSGSGDLMSSLIVDTKFREEMSGKQDLDNDGVYIPNPSSLEIYTPEYIISLDKIITKTLKKNFYARYICHIDTDTDIIAGGYTSDARESKILILRRNNKVFLLPKMVQIYGNSYTGGDVEHCKANLNDKNTFFWNCGLGFLRDKTGVIGDGSKEYTISLTNGKIKKVKIRETRL